jgi:GNAT superfamily N-acetyltransferase
VKVRIADESCAGRVIALDPLARGDLRRQRMLRARVQTGECWIADEGPDVLGYAVRGEFFGFDCLELLFVAERARRRGVGSALISWVEEDRRTGRVFTSTNRSNMPMRALVANRGYAASGVIYNLDPGDPEVVYVKRFDGVDVELPG